MGGNYTRTIETQPSTVPGLTPRPRPHDFPGIPRSRVSKATITLDPSREVDPPVSTFVKRNCLQPHGVLITASAMIWEPSVPISPHSLITPPCGTTLLGRPFHLPYSEMDRFWLIRLSHRHYALSHSPESGNPESTRKLY